jgi:DMSO/TMAO reductase YedYZ heme-binding membrane subunit
MLSRLLIPFGIFTFVWFLLTVLTGLRVIKVKISVHRTLALITLILASIHAGFMIYLTYF